MFTLHQRALNGGCGGWVSSISSFVMVMFQGRPLARLCALNPGSPGESTVFEANSRFVAAVVDPTGQ